MNGVAGAGQQELDEVVEQVRIFVRPIAVGNRRQRMCLEEEFRLVESCKAKDIKRINAHIRI